MPSRRMTLREQRDARRELRQLRQQLQDVRHSGTHLAEGTVCDLVTGKIRAAHALGYTTIVREWGGKLHVYAVKL